MPEKRVKITFQGEEQNGFKVAIVDHREPEHKLELSDGAVLSVRLIPNGVVRIEGKTDSLGSPTYILQNTVVVSVEEPPSPPNDQRH